MAYLLLKLWLLAKPGASFLIDLSLFSLHSFLAFKMILGLSIGELRIDDMTAYID